jgi:hypothetical protein
MASVGVWNECGLLSVHHGGRIGEEILSAQEWKELRHDMFRLRDEMKLMESTFVC